MPIIVKDYVWKQTEKALTITVPVRGIHQSKVDIFYSDRYIKANYEQFFFEALLLYPINVEESKCTITSDYIVFELIKEEPIEWENLEPAISKAEKMKIKLDAIENAHKKVQKKCEEWGNKKAELKRVAVREQMELDSKQLDQIDTIRKDEKSAALGDLKEWQDDLNKKPQKKVKKKTKQLTDTRTRRFEAPPPPEKIGDVPKPRQTTDVAVDFTPRDFPTPCRESRLDEENEWLRKQAEARRSAGFVSEDLRPEEKNPQYLKAKGDEFKKAKNYLGALSAYSFAIKIAPNFVDLYISRSEAHFGIGNFHKAVLDCSTALDMMKPAVEANRLERALCIGRRGMGLCKLGHLTKGIDELEASLKLNPNNPELKAFHFEAEKEWMNQSDPE